MNILAPSSLILPYIGLVSLKNTLGTTIIPNPEMHREIIVIMLAVSRTTCGLNPPS